MKSPVVKRSIVIAGHKTSVSLEDAFGKGQDIAVVRNINLSDLVASLIPTASRNLCRRRSACSCSITIRAKTGNHPAGSVAEAGQTPREIMLVPPNPVGAAA